MKRIHVAPEVSGLGLGRALAEGMLPAARATGDAEIRLDTLPFKTGATALYARLGFRSTSPCYPTLLAGTVFLACPLNPPAGR